MWTRAKASTRPSRRRVIVTAVSLALAVALVGGVFALTSGHPNVRRPLPRSSSASTNLSVHATETEASIEPSSPDPNARTPAAPGRRRDAQTPREQAASTHAARAPIAFYAGCMGQDHGTDCDQPGIFLVNEDGSGLRRTVKSSDRPAWSPDGTHITYVDMSANVSVVDLRTSRSRTVTHFNSAWSASSPAWSPDGRHIAFTNLGLAGTPTSATDPNAEIWLVGVDGSYPHRISDRTMSSSLPAWSPDGRTIAFWAGDSVHGDQVWTMSSDGSNARPLTTGSGQHFDPTWSPDGKYIAYIENPSSGTSPECWTVKDCSKPYQLIVANADGSAPRVLATGGPHDGWPLSPSWSSDGTSIVFGSTRLHNNETDDWRIERVRVAGMVRTTVVRLTDVADPDSGTKITLGGVLPAQAP